MGRIRITGLFLALMLLLGGCVRTEPETRQFFAMDTIMNFTAYGAQAEEALAQAEDYIVNLEKHISVTRQNSDIAMLSRVSGDPVQVSEDTFALLTQALELCAATGGALDITAYPAVKAWGFTTGEYRVPDQGERNELVKLIDYTAVEMNEDSRGVTLPKGMAVDLGAVAKGWAGQRLHDLLVSQGVESAMLVLGGNVQTVGTKPDGSPWRVGIQDPDSETGAYLASVSVADQAVVTSGGYQRFFEENGETYWHIIDPDTAAPARSGVTSATIVGSDGGVCDGLSTALFILGAEESAALWRSGTLEFDYILVLEDGSIHITQGLENTFALMNGYQDRKVTVIAP